MRRSIGWQYSNDTIISIGWQDSNVTIISIGWQDNNVTIICSRWLVWVWSVLQKSKDSNNLELASIFYPPS
jgi:hypothetical protein